MGNCIGLNLTPEDEKYLRDIFWRFLHLDAVRRAMVRGLLAAWKKNPAVLNVEALDAGRMSGLKGLACPLGELNITHRYWEGAVGFFTELVIRSTLQKYASLHRVYTAAIEAILAGPVTVPGETEELFPGLLESFRLMELSQKSAVIQVLRCMFSDERRPNLSTLKGVQGEDGSLDFTEYLIRLIGIRPGIFDDVTRSWLNTLFACISLCPQVYELAAGELVKQVTVIHAAVKTVDEVERSTVTIPKSASNLFATPGGPGGARWTEGKRLPTKEQRGLRGLPGPSPLRRQLQRCDGQSEFDLPEKWPSTRAVTGDEVDEDDGEDAEEESPSGIRPGAGYV